jgi:hypothetical protein
LAFRLKPPSSFFCARIKNPVKTGNVAIFLFSELVCLELAGGRTHDRDPNVRFGVYKFEVNHKKTNERTNERGFLFSQMFRLGSCALKCSTNS